MKRTLLVFAVFACGCVNSVQPISITRLMPLESDMAGSGCAFPQDNTTIITRGSLDVAAGAPQFTIGVTVSGVGYKTPGVRLKTGEIIEEINNVVPILDTLTINYRTSKRIGTLKPFVTKRTVTFPTETLEASLIVPLLSTEFGDQLFNAIAPSAGEEFIDVEADIEFSGKLNTSNAPVRTGIVTFPFRAFRSAPALVCTDPQHYTRYASSGLGTVDFCRYVGQQNGSVGVAAPPSSCCTPGTDPGC